LAFFTNVRDPAKFRKLIDAAGLTFVNGLLTPKPRR
jgi:hypothetical protein